MDNFSLLGTAIVIITLALVFYSIGTWSEHLQHGLRKWHLAFFLLGLAADTAGTLLMGTMVEEKGSTNFLHASTGMLAIVLMGVHALWAIRTLWKGNEKNKREFSKFSIVVWSIWLIPYFVGIYLGAAH